MNILGGQHFVKLSMITSFVLICFINILYLWTCCFRI